MLRSDVYQLERHSQHHVLSFKTDTKMLGVDDTANVWGGLMAPSTSREWLTRECTNFEGRLNDGEERVFSGLPRPITARWSRHCRPWRSSDLSHHIGGIAPSGKSARCQAGCPSRSSGNSRPVRSKNNGVEANVESKHTTSPHPSAHTRALSKPLHRRQEDLFLPPTAKRTARLLSDCKHG